MNVPSGYTALDLVGFTDKGTYSSSSNYVRNDLVHYQGKIWKCKVDDTTNVTPTEGAKWTVWVNSADKITDLTDVNISSVSNNQVLGYNSTTSKWENKTLANVARTGAASDVTYNNTQSGLSATNVKGAIDEVSSDIQTLSNREQERWGTVNLFDKDIMADVQIIELSYKTLYMKPNTTYTVSTDLPQSTDNYANLFVYDSIHTPITNENGVWNGQTRTFTTRSDGIINVAYRKKAFTDTSTGWFLNHNFQIEEGNIATAFQPYAALNVTLTQDTKGLTDNQFENGAVNLAEVDANGYALQGITFIVNADKTISTTGKSTNSTGNKYTSILACSNVANVQENKRYKLSGCPTGGGNALYDVLLFCRDSSNAVLTTIQDYGNGVEFTVPSGTVKTEIYVRCYYDVTVTGKVFKPMITVADMPNSDYAHYVPYAKSNKELTESVLYFPSVACSATATTGNFATVNDSAITADHVIVDCTFANPTAITKDVTWTTSNGSVVLNGICKSATTANITLARKGN